MNTILRTDNGPVATRKSLSAIDPTQQSDAQTKLRQTAKTLVAQAFFAPMLEQMRNSPFKDERFSGGRGGDAFSGLKDQQLVQNMSGPTDRLAETITRRLEKKAEAAAVRASKTHEQIEAANAQVHGNFRAATQGNDSLSPDEVKRNLAAARAFKSFNTTGASHVDIDG